VSAPHRYTITLAGEEVATATTYRGAVLALRTLAAEVPAPCGLSVRLPGGQEVAWLHRDGGVGTYQGSESW
jgi:hypothetical protein